MHPVAPSNLTAVANAWNATILWEWEYSSYSSLALVCEVAVTSSGYTTNVRHLCVGMTLVCLPECTESSLNPIFSWMRVYICLTSNITNINQVYWCVQHTFSGVGLQSVVLLDVHPNEEYTLQIRCGAQKNFWKWGDWSEKVSFKTLTTGKGFACSRCAIEVCRFINHSILAGCLCIVVSSLSSRCSWCVGVEEQGRHWTGGLEGKFFSLHFWSYKNDHVQQISDFFLFYQPLTQRQSHGHLTGYKVNFQSSEENLQHTVYFPPDASTAPFNLSHMATLVGSGNIHATVIAENEDGGSMPSGVLIPLRWTGMSL